MRCSWTSLPLGACSAGAAGSLRTVRQPLHRWRGCQRSPGLLGRLCIGRLARSSQRLILLCSIIFVVSLWFEPLPSSAAGDTHAAVTRSHGAPCFSIKPTEATLARRQVWQATAAAAIASLQPSLPASAAAEADKKVDAKVEAKAEAPKAKAGDAVVEKLPVKETKAKAGDAVVEKLPVKETKAKAGDAVVEKLPVKETKAKAGAVVEEGKPKEVSSAAAEAPKAPKAPKAAPQLAGPSFDPSPEDLAKIRDAYGKLFNDPRRPGAKEELEMAEVLLGQEIEKWSPYKQIYPEDWARLHLARGEARIVLNELSGGQRADKAQAAVQDYCVALEAMEVELRDNPAQDLQWEYPDALVRRAMAFEETKQWEKAVKDYNKAISFLRTAEENSVEAKGVDPIVLNFRGSALGRLGRFEDAAMDFREAAVILAKQKEMRDSAMSQCNEGLALYGAGRHDEALSTLEAAVQNDMALVDAHVAMAAVYWSRGMSEKAEAAWKFACYEIDIGCDDYKDIKWVSEVRRWPQSLVRDLKDFLVKRVQYA